MFQDNNEGGWFSKKVDLFARPEWAVASIDKNADLTPRGPVEANELIGADGRCWVAAPAEPAQVAAPAAPADRNFGSMAGDLAGAPMPAALPVSAYPNDSTLGGADPGMPKVMGGIALGMTECQAVARAGAPGNVAIGTGDRGERKVVLTYLTGTWPGIYHFSDGRLKEIVRAPAPPVPAKPVKKQKAKKPLKPKTATTQTSQRTSAQ
ncbi:MAG: hypothetical protein HY244_19710 [Rhizobiales bacterium]|nr:hypothetical protein [Hyphomicrobiales bacterium]